MDTYLYCLTNSGLYLYRQGTGLLIDGLYGRGPYQCFSPFPERLHRQMLAGQGLFAHLDGLVFTHVHGDHCDADLLYYLRSTRPGMSVYGYGMKGNRPPGRPLAQGIQRLEIGPFSITALDAVHEGADGSCGQELFDLPNCILLLECGQERILLTGDAVLGRREAELVGRLGCMDLVFCNPMQLATDEKCEFFQRISMKRLLLTHLPAPQDDRYCYWNLARQECRERTFGAVRPEIAGQLDWLDERTPEWTERQETGDGRAG